MGSSMRKKKEKKKDFQKPKLRVGKTKAKPDNFTDTSFKAKSIVLNQQSLTTTAPSTTTQLVHYLSLASSSKSDTQRKDAMSYLVTRISSAPVDTAIALPTAILLPKLIPLVLDGSTAVRAQLLKLLHLLPAQDVADRAESVMLYIRAGLTHLATEIRDDALNVLEWLLDIAGHSAVNCPGGWVKTLNSFMSMIGWTTSKSASKWSSESKVTFSNKANKTFSRQLTVLTKLLKAGLQEDVVLEVRSLHQVIFDPDQYRVPTISDPFGYLNLFGAPRDEDATAYMDVESRRRVFHKRFLETVDKGAEIARKAGGETGRAGSSLAKVLKDGMADYSPADDYTL